MNRRNLYHRYDDLIHTPRSRGDEASFKVGERRFKGSILGLGSFTAAYSSNEEPGWAYIYTKDPVKPVMSTLNLPTLAQYELLKTVTAEDCPDIHVLRSPVYHVECADRCDNCQAAAAIGERLHRRYIKHENAIPKDIEDHDSYLNQACLDFLAEVENDPEEQVFHRFIPDLRTLLAKLDDE
jgi:hypothetical protein